MIYIRKGEGPRSLTEYRQRQGASYDGYENKDDVRHALLAEQGYICAYCMRRIAADSMKIEHWHAQNAEDGRGAETELDYRNMLGVCDGYMSKKKKNQTCDTHRGNATLHVDPRDAACIAKIKYLSDGTIRSDDGEINRDLDEILNLNCENAGLKQNRKAAIIELQRYLLRKQPNGTWSIALLEKTQHFYETRTNDYNREYVGVFLYFLKKYLRKAQR